MLVSDLSASEYAPFYHNYILSVGENDLITELGNGKDEFISFLENISKDKLSYAYAEGKWTLAELILHVIDAERVFQYRALRFGRNDKLALAGFDQDIYVPESNAGSRTKKTIIDEYNTVRESTLSLFRSFNDEALKRVGNASGSDMSTRAMGFIICGHQAHHLKIVRERYL
ncbi:DinB family protein [Flagellimonas pacifica]|uniref:DinB superfamily protein n=1 Tax=Flagellimonas pacifica TaxID=1247520 RepID=A0A285MRT4_9FLAO|nr:DinB family protein [Allomuricauda parva]SNY99838.1 DinB superfamily protein [Allomuricauda parva]